MSRETTEARSIARHAAHEWRQHMRYCGPCSRQHRCPDGAVLYKTMNDAEADLDEQRRLDRQPAPRAASADLRRAWSLARSAATRAVLRAGERGPGSSPRGTPIRNTEWTCK